jgi:hypothetical protein
MSLKFVPPKEEAKGLPRHASYVVGSGMKVHGTVAAAKNSFNARGFEYVENPDWKEGDSYYNRRHYVTKQAFILENIDGEWYVLHDIKPGLKSDELPWYKDVWIHNTYSWRNTMVKPTYQEEDYKKIRQSFPMTRDEYVNWRLAVERERLGIG